ncbi:glycoside hydrolase family 32 protein [Halegenticoccus soli]|uniref:glycoside hydrolase family 32 protein n=1 Tax=Halegenticoccus soli TaxID=1985678 RepID=UPI001E5ABED6|nr:glycoside hydrolase family 32 protein [Halegenticoccus soli]
MGTGALAAVSLGGVTDLPSVSKAVSATDSVSDQWRPEYHFSPAEGWMNDPNGLVYHDGVYHLFYQAGETRRRWDHATSTDLITWTEHGTKIPATSSIQAFSGGAVIDHENTAGFGEDALLCMYTGHHDDGTEDQRIAYSTDNGETVHKYDGNPVIPSDVGDFRDPNPFWYDPDESWRMVVSRVQSTDGRPAGIEIYSSENFVDWAYESTYRSGVEGWECPSLIELPVEGANDTRWVLPVSPMEPRSVEFHVGHFTGTDFIAENIVRADYGYDFYATQCWGNTPTERGLNIAWMNNWEYAMEGPNPGWRGAMTVPRTVTLKDRGETTDVRQHPADEITATRTKTLVELDSEIITPSKDPLAKQEVEGRTVELIGTIDPLSSDRVGLRVRQGDTQESVISYDVVEEVLHFDRTNAGEFFDAGYYGTSSMPMEPLDDGTIALRVLIDRCSVEVFANNGRRTMTNLVYPDWNSTGISLFAEEGAAKVEHLIAYELSDNQ